MSTKHTAVPEIVLPKLEVKELNAIKKAFQLTESELQFLINLYQRSCSNSTTLLVKLLKD